MKKTTTIDPREVLERYLRTGLAGDRDAQADMFLEDGVVEFPFAPPGTPRRFEGREEIRAVLAALGRARAGMRVDEDRTVLEVHETADPEVLVAEMEIHVDVEATGDTLRVPYVQVFRIRHGGIALFRDYWATTTADFVKAALGDPGTA
ncbi:nuclear transport factor 2 family protein [Planobispora siamensis]|uniref:SnoaL-like domain-containing protein n=1 Tax=Planobispora siamensis TaxID=936338 RepID=A0A8J3SF52_9ACTN|nr:nuclear transport factor 2 family protein [Planobispora siamensis]GIH91461.1 hypothetical protein Psi01_20910 [Planobispora siamensis]